jgi:sulfate adenylyltransferase
MQHIAPAKSIVLNDRQTCDLELLLNGSFYPLTGFLNEDDYNGVVENMRLKSGQLWPMPIVLSVPSIDKDKYSINEKITLKDQTNLPIAILTIESIYKPDLQKECLYVYRTLDTNHPYVKIVLDNVDVVYIGGKVDKIQDVPHYDYKDLRMSPGQSKKFFSDNNWKTVVGFQTRNPMHRSHYELTKYALQETGDINAKLFLHPVVGLTQSCDVDYHTRVKCYKELLKHYEPGTVKLSLLPLSMRMAGPREAVWHAIIRKNYGCTHFGVGRDHAGPSYKTKEGNNFYGPYDAQNLVYAHADEIGIKVIKSLEIVYVKELDKYMNESQVPDNMTVLKISGTEQRRLLMEGKDIPEWYSFKNVINELRKEYKPLHLQGFCVYIVGLSCSGKSTLANALMARLEEIESHRKITILDADVIRQFLSKGLGFSKEDRSTNVQRIGYVASQIVKHSGICIIANIAPYDQDRLRNRELISGYGTYIEVYMDVGVDICEQRDVKGLYKQARQNVIKNFTGVNDPFEIPTKADIVIDATSTIDQNVETVLKRLVDLRLIVQ